MFKRLSVCLLLACFASGCISLSHTERNELAYLKANGIDVNHARGGFDAPNSALTAGLLNILPGFGNFYLSMGRGSDSSQSTYGFLNLLLWPVSVVWGIPQAAIDAKAQNKRELLYFYHYDHSGQAELERSGLKFP